MKSKHLARRKVSAAIENAVLAKSARRCALCFHLNGDLEEKIGQIAHLDGNRANCLENNLAFLCLPHHSIFDSTTKQHKNYTTTEVKNYRSRLYKAIAKNEHFLGRSNVGAEGVELKTLRVLADVLRKRPAKRSRRRVGARTPSAEAPAFEMTVHTGGYSEDYRAIVLVVDLANRGSSADQVVEWTLQFESLDLALSPSAAPANIVTPVPQWSSLLVRIGPSEFTQGTLFFKAAGKLAEGLPQEPLVGTLGAKTLYGKRLLRKVKIYRLLTLKEHPELAH